MLRTRTIALGLALCAGLAATAAAQAADSPRDTTGTTTPAPQRQRGQRPERFRGALFNGIQLTSAQRSQLQTIQGKYRPEEKSILDQMRPAMQEARAARQRGDTTAARAAFDKTSGERDKLQSLRKQELADVRNVLTPDQQKQFDKNVSEMKSKGREWRGGKAGRGQ